MPYRVNENEVIKYYAEKLITALIKETAEKGQIDPVLFKSKFGLDSKVLAKVRDYLITQNIIETIPS